MQLCIKLLVLIAAVSCCLGDEFDDVVCKANEIPKGVASANFIVGGEEAVPGEFPWMTQITAFGGHSCGGALIHERFVLTAAHCMGNTKYNRFFFGKHNISAQEPGQVERKAAKAVVHELYGTSGNTYDIALVMLNEPVTFTDTIQPICVPPQGTDTAGMLTVSGWGSLQEGGPGSDVLMKVDVPFISDDECRHNTMYYPSHIADSMLCAGYKLGRKDSCQGDSGGPLMRQKADGEGFYHVGVVSWGFGCAREDTPGVYTETSYYTNWIVKTMRSLSK